MAAALVNPVESTKKDLRALIVRAQKPTKVIACALCIGHVLHYNEPCRQWLAMTPAYVFGSFNVWTIATSAFMENSAINLLVDLCLLLYIGSVAIPLWGEVEFVKFVTVAILAGNVAALLAVVLDYGLSGDDTILFNQYGGFGGVVGAFTVVLWQLSPEAKVYLYFTWPLRCRQLPVLLVATALVSVPLGSPVYFVGLTCAGIFWSWFYLRFYQKLDTVRGDHSKSFAFASIFPERIQPLVSAVSEKVYDAARKIGLVPRPLEGFTVLGDSVESNDQARQRQRALAALYVRLTDQ